MSLPEINSLFSYFQDIHSVFTQCKNDALKTDAFAICKNPLSTYVHKLSDHEPLKKNWDRLTKKWEQTRSPEEKAIFIQEGTLQIDAMLRELSEELRSQPMGEQPSCLFDTHVPTLQTLFSYLDSLSYAFAKEKTPDTNKMTFFKALDGTISSLIDSLDEGSALSSGWKAMQQQHTALSPADFVREATQQLPQLVAMVKQELSVRKQLHEAVRTSDTHTKDVSFFQQEEVRALFLETLSAKVEQQQKQMPHTFQAADAFVSRVLQGAYGDSLRAHIIDGCLTQEHFLVLLLTDLVRRQVDIRTVEIFSKIAAEDITAIVCADISNEALLQWLYCDNATLPEAHVPFMRGAVQARFNDEKQFSALREYLALRYAPNAGCLLHLMRHSQQSDLLNTLQPLVEKATFSHLTHACELISCQNASSIHDGILELLNRAKSQEAGQEWLERIILGIAETRGPLALKLADLITDTERRTDTREAAVIIYAKEHCEDALKLLKQFNDDPFLAASIALSHAKAHPKIALNIVDRLTTPEDEETTRVFSAIVTHHFQPPHLDGILSIARSVSLWFQPLFFATIVARLAESIGLAAAYKAVAPHVPESQQSEFLAEITRYAGKDELPTHTCSRLTSELGEEHRPLFSAALMSRRRFSGKATPEVFAEEAALLEAITDPTLLGITLSRYLCGNAAWDIYELDEGRVATLKERIARLLPLVEKTSGQRTFERVQYLTSLLVSSFDRALAVKLVTSINGVSMQRMALTSLLTILHDQVVHVARRKLMAPSSAALPPPPFDFASLPDHAATLCALVKKYADGNAEMYMTLCGIMASFSPSTAIEFFTSSGIQDTDFFRATLMHMALIAFAHSGSMTAKEMEAIATCFSKIPDGRVDLMAIAMRPHQTDRHHALYLEIVRRLVRNPEARPSTPLYTILTECVKRLGRGDPWGCLQMIQLASDPRLLVESIATTITPHLFHSGLLVGALQQGQLTQMRKLLTQRCPHGSADEAYGSLAFACAHHDEKITRELLDGIVDKEAKEEWEEVVGTRQEYSARYRSETFDDEKAHAEFAIEIAPYLRREALEIAKGLTTRAFSLNIVRAIIETAEEYGTVDTLPHYANEITAICSEAQDDDTSSVEEL